MLNSRWSLVVCVLAARAGLGSDTLVTEGIVEAPVAEVWKVFATKEGLEKCVVAKAEIDLRIGGSMKTHYDPKGKLGDENAIEHQILSYEPQRMLSFRCIKTPEKFPFKAAMTKAWSVVYFEPIDGNRTKLRIVGCGYTPDEESQKMRAFFDRGNSWTLKNIQEKMAKPTPKS